MENTNILINRNYSFITVIRNSERSIVAHAINGNGNKVLIKSFFKVKEFSFLNEDGEMIPRELYFFNKLSDSIYVTKLLDYYEDDIYYTVVSEFLDKEWIDLYNYTEEKNEEEHIKQILKNIIQMIYDMSKKGFYHRDIKPENIMINKTNLKVKFIDLEDMFYDLSVEPFGRITGTVGYRSPESITKIKSKIKPNIVFNIGCLLYSCLELANAFDSKQCTIECRFPLIETSSNSAKDFMRKCLNPDPNLRIYFNNLLNDKWFH